MLMSPNEGETGPWVGVLLDIVNLFLNPTHYCFVNYLPVGVVTKRPGTDVLGDHAGETELSRL